MKAKQAHQKVREVLSTQTFELNRPQAHSANQAQSTPVSAHPLKPTHETDPQYQSVDLPSGFHFYPFKQLSIKTLQGSHQAKFSRAHKEGRLRYVVEAISATLGPETSAFSLTPADFYYLMYWQQLNSFTKNPKIITGFCDNEDHNMAVVKGEKPKESLQLQEFLNKTDIQVANFTPSAQFKQICAELKDLDIALGYETMQDVVDYVEKSLTLEDASDFMFTAEYAAYLSKEYGDLTTRCEKVDSLSADALSVLDVYRELASDYGVKEYGIVRCKECGASTRLRISFDALSFLPGSGRDKLTQ